MHDFDILEGEERRHAVIGDLRLGHVLHEGPLAIEYGARGARGERGVVRADGGSGIPLDELADLGNGLRNVARPARISLGVWILSRTKQLTKLEYEYTPHAHAPSAAP